MPSQRSTSAAMSIYGSLIKPALFCLPADLTHSIGHWALRYSAPWRMMAAVGGLAVDDPVLKTRFAGVELPSPVGLAAGFDKDCERIRALSWLGFGFLTAGSIMPEQRPGHPYPRLVRYTDTQSLSDSMGLPSRGLDYCVERLKQTGRARVPVFANIGGFSAEAIAASLFAVEPFVDGIEISLMCPNVLRDGEVFDDVGLLRDILKRTEARRKPAIVRMPNDTARSDRLADLIECCVEGGIDGIKIAGGRPIAEPRLGMKRGTLHGPAVFDAALENVVRAARLTQGRIPIKANGGVRSGSDVLAMLRAGATCVDLYSAFIYQGWGVARRINLELAALLRRETAGQAVENKGGAVEAPV
jgi:dihydroorotate dehydrogenase (fumarate)/dihydroorotate dehydrogenase